MKQVRKKGAFFSRRLRLLPPFQESDGGAGAFDDDDTNKIFIDFLSQGYKLFLEGDDDDAERVVQLHEQIQFVFDEKAGTLEKASAEIQEGNAKMQRQLGADTDGGRPLEREQKRKAVLDEDERKFNELLTKLVNYVTELRKKAAAAAGTLAELTTEVAALDEENASLKHVISLQEMTPADVERMGKEKAELTATLASLREQKEAKQKEVWEGKDALDQAAQRLETKTQKANAAAARLDLRASQRHRVDVDRRHVVDEHGDPQPLAVVEQVLQRRRLARAEEAAEERHRRVTPSSDLHRRG